MADDSIVGDGKMLVIELIIVGQPITDLAITMPATITLNIVTMTFRLGILGREGTKNSLLPGARKPIFAILDSTRRS